MDHKLTAQSFFLYTAPDGDVRLEVYLLDETLWLTQKMMAELFGVEVNTINYHLKEIFKSGELTEGVTIRKIRIVQNEGDRNDDSIELLQHLCTVSEETVKIIRKIDLRTRCYSFFKRHDYQ